MSRLFTTSTTDSIVVAPASSINNLSQRTIMGWVKPLGPTFSTDGSGYIFLKTNGVILPVESTIGPSTAFDALISAPTFAYSADSTAADVLPFGKWSHLAFTFDNTGDRKAHLFINGVEIASYSSQQAAIGSLTDDSACSMQFASYPAYTAGAFNGLIFDNRIYNSILTAANLSAIIAGGPSVNPVPGHMVMQLTFAANAGSIEPDASGNGNVGIITGTIFIGDSPTPTQYTVGIGEYGGNSIAEAFFNPSHYDLIQVLNEGGEVVWSLTYNGVASVNPVSPTKKALVGSYFGASFAIAFPNPYSQDVFQIIGQGDNVVFWVDHTGNSHSA